MITLILLIAGASAAGAMAAGGGPNAWDEVHKAWVKAVEKAVTDDAREEQATAVLDESKKTLDDLRGKQAAAFKKIFDVDRRYEAGREDYAPAVQELEDVWHQADNDYLTQRYKIKEIVSEAEWNDILRILDKKIGKVKKKMEDAVEDKNDDLQDQQEDLEKAERKAAGKK